MYFQKGTNTELLGAIQALNPQENEMLMLAFGEETNIDIPALIEGLNELGITFFGGIFPSVIHGLEKDNAGCVVKKLPMLHPPVLMEGVSGGRFELPDSLMDADGRDGKPTAFVFVDGLTTNIAGLLDYLYNQFGNQLGFIGGGAGSLSLQQKPCIISNSGLHQDAAVLCLADMEAGLGVKHGWEKIAGPFVATRAEQNTIFELNWRNAFEVYREYIKEDSGITITKEAFFDTAKGYPFGIFKERHEEVVRDPLFVGEDGELICVGAVPENTVLYIMRGRRDNLVAAAKEAVSQANGHKPGPYDEVFVVDCISRTLFLEEDFKDELGTISSALPPQGGLQSEGVLSLGEISSFGDDYLEFFNKTLVVGLLEKRNKG